MVSHIDEFALLIGQTGPLIGQQWTISEETRIGRDASCDIVIPDRQVSRIHCRFLVTNDGIYVEDMGSKNGVHVNGTLISNKILLNDGDIIQIALAQQFLFLSSDATVPLDHTKIEKFRPIQKPGRLVLDKQSHQVWINNIELKPPLSASQFLLLEILYENAGNVVARQDLITGIWGDTQAVDISEQALDALIRRLRDRLASLDPNNVYILTIRGHGLRFINPD